MANLMLTTACNFRCDYCFGMEMIGPGHPHQTMSWRLFLDILDWIDRANMPELDIHLMGGEPTLSPLFGRMVSELARRKRKIAVFSNAAVTINEKILTESGRFCVRWVINVNPPDTYRGHQLQTLQEHLALFSSAASLTFNITSSSTEFDHVFVYIDQFGLARHLKIGVTLPTLEHKNAYVKREDFPEIATRIMELVDKAEKNNVALEFECGVPYCLFTAEQHKKLEGLLISHCYSRLDITPTGDVINCLPLCRIAAIPYSSFRDYGQAQKWFRKALAPYASFGSTSACPTCDHLVHGRCRVCLAHALCDLDHIVLPPWPGNETRKTTAPMGAKDHGK